MATINGMYIFVESESVDAGVEVTERPVETGIAISDHVKRNATVLTLSGEIVGSNAANILAQIKKLQREGGVCSYSGRNTFSNCLITSFSTSHPNTIWGGCEFSMTLKEIRVASTSYDPTKNKPTTKTGTQQVVAQSKVTNVYHTIKSGDYIWSLVEAPNAPYKSLSRPPINGKSYSACDWVMAMSPDAFSRKGDFRTLQLNRKVIVGQR